MNDKLKILVVDDELTVRRIIRQYMEKEGYEVLEADNGGQALQLLHQEEPNLMILDIMLPGIDGFTVARSLRQPVETTAVTNIPIIMLTARSEEMDRITGFELGTDDYVTKPFSPRELVMRVKALLRRSANTDNPLSIDTASPIVFDNLRLDPNTRTVEKDGESIELTHKEFELLFFLASHPRHVFTRNQLLDKVWGYDFYGDDSNVTVHIHRLREKIEIDPAKPQYIHTVWGVGYKFEAQ
ncbi:MAG: response regulator transcription factor [Anaerolineae bacterium]|nr:response regulator transcription factor [Anaerolineae bacterium]